MLMKIEMENEPTDGWEKNMQQQQHQYPAYKT